MHEEGSWAALEIILLLAEADARWGDYRSAVALLDTATQVAGELPGAFTMKRARWARLQAISQHDDRRPLRAIA